MNKQVDWKTIERDAKENLAGLIFDCEQYFDNQIDAVAKGIYDAENVRVIMIAGPSSSGKTTFSKMLSDRLQHYGIKTHYIGMDDFFIDREKVPFLPSGVRDYDSLRALDMPLLNKVIKSILHSEQISIPEYDFIEGKRKKEFKELTLFPEDLVIIEGIHALNPILINDFDSSRIVKVVIRPQRSFVMPSGIVLEPEELRLLRRTIRDYYTRGHSIDATAKQWNEVRRAEDKYITPYLTTADYNVDSAHEYELFLYKEYLGTILKDTTNTYYTNIRNAFLEISDTPIGDIPETSLLTEFAVKLR